MRVLYLSRPTLFSVPGGDTIQLVKTKAALEEKYAIEIDIWNGVDDIEYKDYDLLHFFNLIRPNNILAHISHGVPYVISPIYVDYSEYDQKVRGGMSGKLAQILGKFGSEYSKSMMRWIKNGEYPGSLEYLMRGYKNSIKKILRSSAGVLANSKSEFNRLRSDFQFDCPAFIIPNASDLSQETGANDRSGVLCVARIEGIKNQLKLIKAIKETNLSLTIIGKASPNHLAYYKACKEEANDQIRFVDHIDHDELLNYYKKAKVHAMISWFETTGLSTLEAAACGCAIVISDKGDQQDYFKDAAFYADPDSVESIKKAILAAYNAAPSSKLQREIKENFTWEIAAAKTYKAYKQITK